MGEIWAVIPARGGSKGVAGKNLRRVGGVPLVERSIRALRACGKVDRVIVSTDSVEIAAAARKAGADVVMRPDDLAGDRASSESAVLHVLDTLRRAEGTPEAVMLVQCTSPFTSPETFGKLAEMVVDFDSAFTAVYSHRFMWATDDDGNAVGINHDAAVRLPRQQLPPQYLENGAGYVMRTEGFISAGHRFFGRVGICLDDEANDLEIDTMDDLSLARAVAAQRFGGRPSADRLRAVGAVVFDFDGVLTDDRVVVLQDGTEAIVAHRGDGMGISRLRAAGFKLLILSTETNPVVSARGKKLGIEVIQGCSNKLEALVEWCDGNGTQPADCLFVGNDVNDQICMEAVGLSACPADARVEIRGIADWVLDRPGGFGAAREVCDALLAAGDGPFQDRVSQGART